MAVSGFGPVGAPSIAQSVNGHADACGNVLQDEPQEIGDQLALAFAAAGTGARFVHSGGQPRRAVDHRSACGPRARAV